MILGVLNSNGMKIYTRLTSQEVWSGYWNIIFTVKGLHANFGEVGAEIAILCGSFGLAFRSKFGGEWSVWNEVSLKQ